MFGMIQSKYIGPISKSTLKHNRDFVSKMFSDVRRDKEEEIALVNRHIERLENMPVDDISFNSLDSRGYWHNVTISYNDAVYLAKLVSNDERDLNRIYIKREALRKQYSDIIEERKSILSIGEKK